MYAAKTGQENSLDILPHADLKANEKSDLILFLGDLLDKACSPASKSETVIQYFKRDSSDQFFDYFFGMEFIQSDYKKALQTLQKFELSSRKRIVAYTGLATIAILELDLPKIEFYLNKLKEFPVHAFQRFAIDPLKCIDAIYYYLKGAIIKKDFLGEITRFYFNPHLYKGKYYGEKSNELIYSLSAYILMICAKPQKVLRYTRAIDSIYPVDLSIITPYSFLENIANINSYFQLEYKGKVLESTNHIAAAYKADEESFTPFMKAVFYALKIKNALLQENYDSIPAYMKSLVEICNKSGNKMSRLFISFVLLKNSKLAIANPVFYKQVQYDNTRLIRQTGVSPDMFMSQVTVFKNK